MAVRITTPDNMTVRVTNEDGSEIRDITSIDIEIRPNDVVVAKIEVYVAHLDIVAEVKE